LLEAPAHCKKVDIKLQSKNEKSRKLFFYGGNSLMRKKCLGSLAIVLALSIGIFSWSNVCSPQAGKPGEDALDYNIVTLRQGEKFATVHFEIMLSPGQEDMLVGMFFLCEHMFGCGGQKVIMNQSKQSKFYPWTMEFLNIVSGSGSICRSTETPSAGYIYDDLLRRSYDKKQKFLLPEGSYFLIQFSCKKNSPEAETAKELAGRVFLDPNDPYNNRNQEDPNFGEDVLNFTGKVDSILYPVLVFDYDERVRSVFWPIRADEPSPTQMPTEYKLFLKSRPSRWSKS
jgi:hypothetical protein